MAVAHSTLTTSTATESGINDGPITKTQTITENGANPCLVCGVSLWDGVGNNISDDSSSVTGITIDGNALTFLQESGNVGIRNYVYYRAGAIGTSKSLVVTFEDTDNVGLMFTTGITSNTYTGVDQTTPIAQSAETSGNNLNPEGTMTPASTDNLIGDCTVVYRGGATYTLTEDGAGTNRTLSLVGTLGSRHYICRTDVSGVSGAQTMSYNISGSVGKTWGMALFELAAATAATQSVQDPVLSPASVAPFPR